MKLAVAGSIRVFPATNSLIIRQHEDVHQVIRQILDQIREAAPVDKERLADKLQTRVVPGCRRP